MVYTMNPDRIFRLSITFLASLLVALVLIFVSILVTGCDVIDFSSLVELTTEPVLIEEATPSPVEEILPTPTRILERTETEYILVVSSKNTLRGIASEVYGDESRWEEIWEANKLTIEDPNFIFVGQKLIIPNLDLE